MSLGGGGAPAKQKTSKVSEIWEREGRPHLSQLIARAETSARAAMASALEAESAAARTRDAKDAVSQLVRDLPELGRRMHGAFRLCFFVFAILQM